MGVKENFLKIYAENIKREGSGELLKYLESSDFFTAPASTRFHLSKEGGLAEHSLNVYRRLVKLCKADGCKLTPETLAICGLLHDICKVDVYKPGTRNEKQKDGSWKTVPCYTFEDSLPYGRGEKSVYMIGSFLKLSREEAIAINWHMGGFDDRVKGGSYSLSPAFEKYPLALYLHLADMQATYLDESSK